MQRHWIFGITIISLLLGAIAQSAAGFGGAIIGTLLVSKSTINFSLGVFLLVIFAIFLMLTLRRGSQASSSAVALVTTMIGILSGAMTVIGAFILILLTSIFIAISFAIIMAKGSLVAMIVAVSAATIWPIQAFLIGRAALKGNKEYVMIRTIAINFAATKGTNFRYANLTDTDFTQANLKGADFRSAILQNVCWFEVQMLDQARVTGTVLADPDVCELLVSKNGRAKSFERKNLKGVDLSNSDISNANLSETDISESNLQNTNLTNSNLTKTQAIGTNFYRANLTGACIEAWNIDSTTRLEGVLCDYVYLLANQQERRPSSGDFGKDEFSKLFQEVLNTVDFIFKNGIDWQAFLISFNQLRNQMRIENEYAEMSVQSIENKGDNVLVVKVAISDEEFSKEKFHREFIQQYNHQLSLQEVKYLALLQGKEDVISLYRQQAGDMKEIINALVQKQTINIAGGNIKMRDNVSKIAGRDILEHIDHSEVTTGSSFNGDHAQQFLQTTTPQSSKNEVSELLSFIRQELSQIDLPEVIKAEASHEIEGAEIQLKKEPPEKQKMVDKLKNAIAALKEAGSLGKEAVMLGNLIGKAIEWGGEQWTDWIA